MHTISLPLRKPRTVALFKTPLSDRCLGKDEFFKYFLMNMMLIWRYNFATTSCAEEPYPVNFLTIVAFSVSLRLKTCSLIFDPKLESNNRSPGQVNRI